MATLKITVCDVCRAPDKKTAMYRVGKETTLRRLHLCADDAKGVEKLLSATTPVRPRGSNKLTTLAEVEARKAATAPVKKAAAKRTARTPRQKP